MIKINRTSVFILIILLFISCKKESVKPQFELLTSENTSLKFENKLDQSKDWNVMNYMYFFNGGGVGAGDFNNDGWIDLYFTSNSSENKLFLNEGSFHFKDVTKIANASGVKGWSTGVSVVDINNDGMLDIYICKVGKFKKLSGKNELLICQRIENGVPIYQDEAVKYGLDFIGFSTQASFFDYDLDGDLDLYLLNHSVHENGTFGERKYFLGKSHPLSGDKFFKNENGLFKEVTSSVGIHSMVIGYGLGISTGDINGDGWPDIYIGNDFHENDYLYINQKDGTFKELLNDQMMHTSRFSMGVDVGDLNNDGHEDIVSMDMLPYDPFVLKTSLGEDEYNAFYFKVNYGYNIQFARNNLQLNNGNGTFSEIGLYSKMHATDWSWSALLMDFEDDGYKDIFVSNGIPARMNDIDYINFRMNDENHQFKTSADRMEESDLEIISKIPDVKFPNKFLRNNRALRFEDWEALISNNKNSYSNGAAYADLDNDGDLDIIVNNINDSPFIYNNQSKVDTNSFLNIRMVGSPNNINGIGSRVIAYLKNGDKIISENYPVRGFQSSMHVPLHIGLGSIQNVDSIVLIWPDLRYQKIEKNQTNKLLELKWSDQLPKIYLNSPASSKPFNDITAKVKLNYLHSENPFIEFDRERLIPFMVSTLGPAVTVGDVNGDSLDDIFFGSSKRRKSLLYFQESDGTFSLSKQNLIRQDSTFEDVDALFVDIDNDKDNDLVVAPGGNEYWGDSEYLRPRYYLNDGKGNFNERYFFPEVYMTASSVVASDFNNDGLVDFFFGARSVPRTYGVPPESAMLFNKGNNLFENVTNTAHKNLKSLGMVTDASTLDIDNDGDEDIVLAVEWDAVKILLNNHNTFDVISISDHKGWWSFVLPNDYDGDGDMDILAGNIGENSKFAPNDKEPVCLYVNDFDGNGQVEQVLTYYLGGREIPFANHAELTKQLPSLKKKYLYAKNFASASIEDLFGKDKISESKKYSINTISNSYFENTGNLKFIRKDLPQRLQFSTIKAGTIVKKVDSIDVLLGGNFYENNIEMGRYDADYADLITFNNKKISQPISLKVKGQVRHIVPLKIRGKNCFLLVRNNDTAVVLERNE